MKKFIGTIGWAAAFVGVFAILWFFSTSDKYTLESVPETADLSILKHVHTLYGPEEDVDMVSFYLLGVSGDTIAWKNQDYNPFVNARGLVYIPQRGIYDCRSKEMQLVLDLKDYYSRVELVAVDGEEKVQIFLGRPAIDITKLGGANPNVKQYIYDLETRKLSE